MSEDNKGAQTFECLLNWLKVTDAWVIKGYENKFPRMVYAVLGFILLLLIL